VLIVRDVIFTYIQVSRPTLVDISGCGWATMFHLERPTERDNILKSFTAGGYFLNHPVGTTITSSARTWVSVSFTPWKLHV